MSREGEPYSSEEVIQSVQAEVPVTGPEKAKKEKEEGYFGENLFEAIMKGEVEETKRLLEIRPELVKKPIDENYNQYALHIAARFDMTDIINILLEHGADIHAKDSEWGAEALDEAIRCDHLPAVQLLLERGADINQGDKYNHTPLYRAAMFNHYEMARFLLDHGADPAIHVNANMGHTSTPYNVAKARGHKETVELFESRGISK